MDELINLLDQMKSSTLSNYVIAGLSSSLLENGKVRYFENSRDHQDSITPHTHRFDFTCLVLDGYVTNRIWHLCEGGDLFVCSMLDYKGSVGDHVVASTNPETEAYDDTDYENVAGEFYSMTYNQFHSIRFSKGAKVLFFEGPQVTNTSFIIEPYVDGVLIPTYQKLDYMFLKTK